MLTEAPLLIVFPMLMAYAAASDLLTMTIPNRLSLALVIGFAALACFGGLTLEAVMMHMAAGAVVLAVTFCLFAFGWIGGGDAKLAAATALWLGFGVLADYLVIAALGGGVLTGLILLLRRMPVTVPRNWLWLSRLQDAAGGVPYGIALAAAALVVYPDTEIWTAILAR